jgi:hypothetical protein
MHRTSICLFALAVFALPLGAAIAAEATDLPLRKAGRWEQKTTMEEAGKKHEQTLTICIDADMERNTALASDAEHKKSCTKYEVKKSGDTVVVESTCNMNKRDVESRTEMSGDFQSAFNVKINSTTSGIQDSQTVSIKRVIEQQGKYVGESCGDLKAGEAMGADGTKIMVQ